MSDFNDAVIAEFRANAGKVGGGFTGAPMLLLHTTGARSGAERVNPLVYQEVGDDVAVFASMGGAPTHPAWFHNLVAHPDVTVEIGTDTVPMRARVDRGRRARAHLGTAEGADVGLRGLRGQDRARHPGGRARAGVIVRSAGSLSPRRQPGGARAG